MGQGKLALHVMESKTTPAPITLTPIYTVNSLKSDTIVIIRLFNSSGTVARQYKFHPPVQDSINTTFSLAAKKIVGKLSISDLVLFPRELFL